MNILKSWKTTLIGICLIAVGVFSVFKINTTTWTEACLPIAIGIALMLSPDTIIKSITSIFKKN